MENPDALVVKKVLECVEHFYQVHSEIKESHGIRHVIAVYEHTRKAVRVHAPPLSSKQSMQVLLAALLHDVDDHKYFPTHSAYENAIQIMSNAASSLLEAQSQDLVVQMISYVSCSKNRNSVPKVVSVKDAYWMLIPRWADRLEAVGRVGVLRCYQYNRESGQPLVSENTPRPQTLQQVWDFVTPERFQAYDGSSTDMISHYYDKLLHVARPPPLIVRNSYLEKMAEASSKELVEVCLRFGKTGVVDEDYIQSLAVSM